MILSEKLVHELQETQKKLDGEGELLSKTQLDRYYDKFRKQFNPDELSSLDGEALLQTMHDHGNKDSLVYWLEFKNDDEVPMVRFGSIAGGTALKFGIYKRKETGAWMSGSPAKQRELSVEEAVEEARKHRDQMITGFKLLEELPANGSDDDYKELQDQMDKLIPGLSNSSWGHKYFHMLFPDKIDDFHNPDYQRFHLIKLLQMPPRPKGRYVCGGRYVAIANEMDIRIHTLCGILNSRNGDRPHRYWRIGTQLGGVDSRWDLMKSGNCVAIASAVTDLSDISYDAASKERIRAALTNHDPDRDPRAIGRETQQVFNYAAAINENDLVLASEGQKVLGIGKVVGPYEYEPNSDAPHRLPVEWLSFDEWKTPEKEGLQTTVYPLRKAVNLVEAERVLQKAPTGPIGTLAPLGRPAVRLEGVLGRIQSVLERKGQVILYGPPGTGKTYWAERAVRELAAHNRFGKPFEQLSEEQQTVIVGKEKKSPGMVRLCTFHPAYGYEDFIEGYHPETAGDNLVFKRHDGIFKKISGDALANNGYKYYLIIDEINRGDIPRIFGELLTILEKDKRGKAVQLAISGESFKVPDNLYIIGTMNTADRSIALLDTALRRRFGFIELMPDSSLLGKTKIEDIQLAAWLDALNNNIREKIGADARNLQIGHAYLFDKGKPVIKFPKFVKIVQDDILPLLEEYCYDDYANLEGILGKGLVDKKKLRTRNELFEADRKDDLIQALRAIDPKLETAAQVVDSEAESPEEEELDDGTDEGDTSE